MQLTELYTKLKSIGLPIAYQRFQKAQALPFIVYYRQGNADVIADNVNYHGSDNVIVEFYSTQKDTVNEAKIEKVLKDNEIVYTVNEIYIDDDKMHETIYEFQII